ncbi:hypothetical protein [Pedobacter sp. NJ-S-72]
MKKNISIIVCILFSFCAKAQQLLPAGSKIIGNTFYQAPDGGVYQYKGSQYLPNAYFKISNKVSIDSLLNLKVDKITGKGLSSEDYTTTEKSKLALQSGTNTGDQNLLPYQLRSEKGGVNGYASLDVSGKVPLSQLPPISVTVDPVPTSGSTNAVSSGGTFTALAGKVNSGTLTVGRIPYIAAGNTLVDNSNLQWDNTNRRIVLGGLSQGLRFANTGSTMTTEIGFLGAGATNFDFKNTTNNLLGFTILMPSTTTPGRVGIGNIAPGSYPTEAQLYVYGGGTGANIDMRGDAAITDQANMDLEGADFGTGTPNSLGFSYYGNQYNLGGTILGYSKNNSQMGVIRFDQANIAIIKSDHGATIVPIRFGINDIEIANLNDKGLSYRYDFSSVNSANPRWLADKGYIDGKFSNYMDLSSPQSIFGLKKFSNLEYNPSGTNAQVRFGTYTDGTINNGAIILNSIQTDGTVRSMALRTESLGGVDRSTTFRDLDGVAALTLDLASGKTIGANTTGNASTATNSSLWSGQNYDSLPKAGNFNFMVNNGTGGWGYATPANTLDNLGISSGTYLPNISIKTGGGMSIVSSKGMYSRVGNIVTVTIQAIVTWVTLTPTSFKVSLPLPSPGMNTISDCMGVAVLGSPTPSITPPPGVAGTVYASYPYEFAYTDVFTPTAANTSGSFLSLNFQYIIK